MQTKSGGQGSPSAGMSPHQKLRLEVDSWCSKGIIVPFEGRLTPELARVLLEKNDNNRPVRRLHVSKMARDIRAGAWVVNGEAIIISIDGFLNDGQQRCLAVLEANEAIPTMFVAGVSRESRTTLDQGAARTLSDYLGIEGHANPKMMSALINLVWQYTNWRTFDAAGRYQPTKQEALDYATANEDKLNQAINLITHNKSGILFSKPLIAAVYYLICERALERKPVEDFFDGLLSGSGLNPGGLILYTRNRLIREKNKHKNEQAELIIRAWNISRVKGINTLVKSIQIQHGALPEIEE